MEIDSGSPQEQLIKRPGRISRYEIMETLGYGASCKVKLGVDTATGQRVAVKIFDDSMDPESVQLLLAEVNSMKQLKEHDNVIKPIEFGNDIYEKGCGTTRRVMYIVIELATGGELMNFLQVSGRFSESLARYFFIQLLKGLEHCHLSGITHRDLKPENLLLDHQYNLKIVDFGCAGPIAGRDGRGFLSTTLGTVHFMAPEIHLKMPYQGESIDLFAAAIILFIMVSEHEPFMTAQSVDPFYKCIAKGRSDIFWAQHTKNKPNGQDFYSEEFKDLVWKMLQLDPQERLSLSEVKAHPWAQGEVPSQDEVYMVLESRAKLVQDSI